MKASIKIIRIKLKAVLNTLIYLPLSGAHVIQPVLFYVFIVVFFCKTTFQIAVIWLSP